MLSTSSAYVDHAALRYSLLSLQSLPLANVRYGNCHFILEGKVVDFRFIRMVIVPVLRLGALNLSICIKKHSGENLNR